MFKLNANNSIRINRGDDGDRFEIQLTTGNFDEKFPIVVAPILSIESDLDCSVNDKIWKKKVKLDGVYSFMYYNGDWLLENEVVDLAEYGITCRDEAENYNTIVVVYDQTRCEIYFYICEMNTPIEQYLVKKTFNKNGDIITEFGFKPPVKTIDPNIISENGNITLSLESNDTIDLEGGEYYYLIRALYFDKTINKYKNTTITNKYPFYVIDDGFDRRW